VPDERKIVFDEKLEQIPIAGALLFVSPAKVFFMPFIISFVFAPADGEVLIRF
jgi:hypothetical protein